MAFTKITGPGIHTLTNIVSHNVKSSGIITAVNGNLNGWLAVGSTASFSGNVSIGGTLTYDDVTNVESVGLITAKNGIFIPDDKKLELGNAAGSGDLSIFYDSTPGESLITHTGPGVFKIEGNSSNNIFIRPKSGENSITAKPDKDVELYYNNELRFSTSGVGATIRDSAASGGGISNSLDLLNIGNHSGDGSSISFLRSPGNTRAQIIAVKNETSNNETDLVFKTTKNGGTLTESLRILGNTQRVGIGTTIPNAPIHVQSSDNTLGILTSTDDGANLDLSDNDTMSRIRSVDGRLQLYADFGSNVSDSSIRFFVDGANEKVRILSTGGITFNGDTAAANALDDYEEGSWTPTVLSEGNIGTPSYTCTYTKIGRLVTINADIAHLTDTTSSTNIKIGGLPYVPSVTTAREHSAVCHGERYGGENIIVAYIVYNSGSYGINFRFGVPTNHFSYVKHSHISDNGEDNNLRFTLTYEIL